MQRGCAQAFLYLHSLAAVQRPHVSLTRSSAGCLMTREVLFYAAQGGALCVPWGQAVGRRVGTFSRNSAVGRLQALRGRDGHAADRTGRVSAQLLLVLPFQHHGLTPRPDAQRCAGLASRALPNEGTAGDGVPSPQSFENRAPEDLHIPVLAEEVAEVFRGVEGGVKRFIDGTVGMGGHSSAICREHSDTLQLLMGIDQVARLFVWSCAHDSGGAQSL